MTAAEAVAKYRKHASALRRMQCWAGSPPRTKSAAVRREAEMNEALAHLRELRLEDVLVRLHEERRLLDSAYGTDGYDPDGARRKRGRAKHHQYRVRQLIRRK